MQRKPRIFISYRRLDSVDITGRIYDRLIDAFGKNNVFVDVDIIPLGADFRRIINSGIARADIVLVIIGKQWASELITRQNTPDDFVRLEVESAVKQGKRVIPVLVNGALMPNPADLATIIPTEFFYRNAAQIESGRDFDNDVNALIRDLKRSFPEPLIQQNKSQKQPRGIDLRRVSIVGLGLIILLGFLLIVMPLINGTIGVATPTTQVVQLSTETIPTQTAITIIPPSETLHPTATINPTQAPTVTFTLTAIPTEMPTQATSSTFTPILTNTVTPLQTDIPLSSQTESAIVTVKSGNANLRSGPGTNYNITGSADAGEQLNVIARSGDGNSKWYLVVHEGNDAWIWSGTVNLTPDNAEIALAATIPAPPPTAPVSQNATAKDGKILLSTMPGPLIVEPLTITKQATIRIECYGNPWTEVKISLPGRGVLYKNDPRVSNVLEVNLEPNNYYLERSGYDDEHCYVYDVTG